MNIKKTADEIFKNCKFKSTQKGDVSEKLLEQGFFDTKELPIGLKSRNKFLSGNPIDVLEIFKEQN